jgi:hypothetical protein
MQFPAYHFEGDVVVAAGQGFCRDYLQFPFTVPPGAGSIRLRLTYSPASVGKIDNLITLGLFDPAGFRGQAHRHPPDAEVIVSPEKATPGFVVGGIQPGSWLAQLAVHAVIEDVKPCHYSLDITILGLEGNLKPRPNYPAAPTIVSSRPGWYVGELHSHTLHSDGTFTPAGLIEEAHQNHLDFLAVTDHNTTTALAEIDPATLGSMLLIPGMELTTYYGHALVLGIRDWIDWRTGYNRYSISDAARQAHAQGGLFIMAHPYAVGSPYCTGCQWEFTDFNLDLADAYEIWNSQWPDSTDQNPKGLHAWHELQETGRRLPATGGTDFHSLGDWGGYSPRVWVYARELSVPAILEGIRKGKVIISSGPQLHLQVLTSGDDLPGEIGDTVQAVYLEMTISMNWDNAPQGARLFVRNTHDVILSANVTTNGSLQQKVCIDGDDRVWIEMYDGNGYLSAMTNPIYIKSV